MSVTKVTGMMQTGTKGGDIPSAGTMVIDTDGDYFDITGTTGITGMTVAAGRRFTLQFDGAVVITDNAAITLSGAANFTTAAGDILSFVATAANTVVQTGYSLVDGGSPVAAAGGEDGLTNNSNTTWMEVSADEEVTTPLQPSFSAYLTSNGTGVIGGATTYHITQAFTEHFDIGSNFDASSGTFTAPVTGKYILATWIHASGIDAAHSYYEAMFTTSNFQYRFDHNELDSGFAGTWYAKGTIVADMDASDTAYLTYRLSGGSTGTANISGGTTGVWFSGMLIG